MRLAGAPLALGTLAAALVLAAMRGRVVGHGSLTGTYRREE